MECRRRPLPRPGDSHAGCLDAAPEAVSEGNPLHRRQARGSRGRLWCWQQQNSTFVAFGLIWNHTNSFFCYEKRNLAKQQKLDFYFKPVQRNNKTMSHSHPPLLSWHLDLRMSFLPSRLRNSEPQRYTVFMSTRKIHVFIFFKSSKSAIFIVALL